MGFELVWIPISTPTPTPGGVPWRSNEGGLYDTVFVVIKLGLLEFILFITGRGYIKFGTICFEFMFDPVDDATDDIGDNKLDDEDWTLVEI